MIGTGEAWTRAPAAVCTALALVAVIALFAALAPAASAQAPSVCTGDLTADGVAKKPAPALRFGITPAGEAGAAGPAVPAVPDDPPKTLAALARLRPPGVPFVLRLNRFFWSGGEETIRRFETLVRRYTSRGYLVELQLRYHPTTEQEGDVPAFVTWVRGVIRRFGSNPRVVAAQVTNEVNLTISPDSSDGAYEGAKDALIEGVKAAKAEAIRRGYRQLEIGFNWFYRTDPSSERQFWEYLRDHGGPSFVKAVDWVGLDAYPGTVFPPAENPGGERNGMVAAMSQLRKCFMPIPGIPASVPIHVEENGWPTGPGRSEDYQAQALETMVRAVHDFHGTYNVTDYRWFDLRDHATSSENFQHHYGLLRDDYSEKPAFGVYRSLLPQLAPAPRPRPRPRRVRLALFLHYRTHRSRAGRRCARRRVKARLGGTDASKRVRYVDFYVDRRYFGRDARYPFVFDIELGRIGREQVYEVGSRSRLSDGRTAHRSARFRACVSSG